MITPLRLVRRSIGTVLGLGGVTCCLTMLFLSSRLLLGVGGSCASGGPYVVATPCPDAIGWIMPVSIIGGLAAVGLYAASLLPVGPRLIPLAWPALFLSLGWNFLASSLEGPGVETGFLVCAVVFAFMGGVPLFFMLNRDALRVLFWGPSPKPAPAPPPAGSVRWTTSVVLPGEDDRRGDRDRPADAPVPPARPASRFVELTPQDAVVGGPGGSGDLVGQLERLSLLHESGRLDDAEYAAAKARLLNGSR
ncbi:SHOCT domain-containing protein [Sphaerisporangium sp. NPDC049002]|uniref:SHOCT domain-containing protein n=1 Tax=Sphaerisporangium sp. NPDC049002 TaxID=3155392 RepID=UPI0033CEB492